MNLLEDLLKDGIYACGTARKDRKGFPEMLKKAKLPNRCVQWLHGHEGGVGDKCYLVYGIIGMCMYVKQREGGWVSSYRILYNINNREKSVEKGCAWNIIQCHVLCATVYNVCVCMPESVCMCIEIYSTDTRT